MDYKYYLPDKNNQPIEHVTQSNSLIIIGANGSGKSKLGEWMEKRDEKTTYRIGAQRSLVFGKYIQQKSYVQATNLLLYGNENKQYSHDLRWEYDGEKYNYTSALLRDYENVLSALLALKAKEQEEYISKCKTRESDGKNHDNVPPMVTDVLQRIWESIFSQRSIILDDAKVTAVYSNGGVTNEYNGRDMSDGERVALYLIAQSLCVPKDKTIIIDEPEIHLHRSIMNRLWTAIEKERQDCLFVYLTHDTQFAANHGQTKKIWTKGYDGGHWELFEIEDSSLPDELLLNLLGNRRPVLFVEGTADSYDTKLYSELYKEYYVVPCGSCSNVITRTKAMQANGQLHHLKCYGLIDRDFRSDDELTKLAGNGVYTIKVAEVENLFLTEELLVVLNSIMGFHDTSNINKIKEYVIKERFASQINKQICNAMISELKHCLSTTDIAGKNDDEVKNSFEKTYNNINYDEIKMEKEAIFNDALKANDYAKILSVFNCKSLSTSIGHFLGVGDSEYSAFIIRQLDGDRAKEVIDSLVCYLPTEIER